MPIAVSICATRTLREQPSAVSRWPKATLREQPCGTGFGLGQKATRGAFGHAVRTTL
ncbi:MAG: hypothetical protein F6K26_09040 [Moorea sp. SIO2I5]|nr:hypothetical protein [Moorena sp. SIO2I5]